MEIVLPAAVFSRKDKKQKQTNEPINQPTNHQTNSNKKKEEAQGKTQRHVTVSKFSGKPYLKSWNLMFLKVMYAQSRYLSGELKQN